jgi:hypothetical protein
MSHRIVFKHAVLLFPVKTLYSAINDWSFYDEDHYLLLELGGDNNCTTSHPDSNQEVVSRDWAALAFGDRYRLIEEAVKLSADCECGGMRLSTQRHTSPETYVRHVRKAMANPIRFDEANGIGITVNATFKESTPCLNEVDVKKLQYHAQPPDEIEGGKVWRLNPLNRATIPSPKLRLL